MRYFYLLNKHFVLLAWILVALTGCSMVNEFYDKHQVFIDRRNSEIGRNINDVLKSYTPGTNPIINNIGDGQKEYQFTGSGQCSWATMVDTETEEIVSWKFLRDESLCETEKMYSGPW